jgi:hypothetical protein
LLAANSLQSAAHPNLKSHPKMAGFLSAATAAHSLADHQKSRPKPAEFSRLLAANSIQQAAHQKFHPPKTADFLWLLPAK